MPLGDAEPTGQGSAIFRVLTKARTAGDLTDALTIKNNKRSTGEDSAKQ